MGVIIPRRAKSFMVGMSFVHRATCMKDSFDQHARKFDPVCDADWSKSLNIKSDASGMQCWKCIIVDATLLDDIC